MDYIELDIKVKPYYPWAEVLISQLAEIGFESFTENDQRLQAYIPQEDFQEELLNDTFIVQIPENVSLRYEQKLIKSQNWNATWEADFKPVVVDNRLIIHAPFHTVEKEYPLKVLIQPQMSFGTGHHQTTWLLSKVLLDEDLTGKSVLDVGTGTGILAILAQKLGASYILGTDIEPDACENARENLKRNNLENIHILEGDIDVVPDDVFDVVIANINKNVLKRHLAQYNKHCKKAGKLFLSGFFVADVKELISAASEVGFKHLKTYDKEEWAVLEFIKN